MSAPELTGVLPVLATPFTIDLDVDLSSLAKLTEWQVDSGAGGVAVFGFASEGFALNGAERARILDRIAAVEDQHRKPLTMREKVAIEGAE